jgi:hypothetical protein
VAGTPEDQEALPRPQIEEARRRIAACRAKGDGVLDLGGLHLDDDALELLTPEIERLPPLRVLYLGLSATVRRKSRYSLSASDKKEGNALRTLPSRLINSPPCPPPSASSPHS